MYLIYRHTPVYRYKYYYNLYTDMLTYTDINTPVYSCILLYTDIFLYADKSTTVYSRIQTYLLLYIDISPPLVHRHIFTPEHNGFVLTLTSLLPP